MPNGGSYHSSREYSYQTSQHDRQTDGMVVKITANVSLSLWYGTRTIPHFFCGRHPKGVLLFRQTGETLLSQYSISGGGKAQTALVLISRLLTISLSVDALHP